MAVLGTAAEAGDAREERAVERQGAHGGARCVQRLGLPQLGGEREVVVPGFLVHLGGAPEQLGRLAVPEHGSRTLGGLEQVRQAGGAVATRPGVLGHRGDELGLTLRQPSCEQARPLAVKLPPAFAPEALVYRLGEGRQREPVDAAGLGRGLEEAPLHEAADGGVRGRGLGAEELGEALPMRRLADDRQRLESGEVAGGQRLQALAIGELDLVGGREPCERGSEGFHSPCRKRRTRASMRAWRSCCSRAGLPSERS